MSGPPLALLRWANEAQRRIAESRRALYRAAGASRPLRILPYRGYGTAGRVRVRARVVENRGRLEPSLQRGLFGAAAASLKRYRTAEVPGVHVRVLWGGSRFEGRTDEEGFLDLRVAPPAGVGAGLHRLELSLGDAPAGVAVEAQVLVVGDRARFGVISDIDDTIIVTGVHNLARRAWALFLTEATRRRPFEGAPELYRALAAGAGGEQNNPVFYVSSSPWNLYDHLDHFIHVHDLPVGPLLLRDWGLSRDGFAPDGTHGHKLDEIGAVLDAFPELPFVLIGDSGQHDPEHYARVVRAQGERILAVYIRRVSSRPGRDEGLSAIAAEVASRGSELVVFGDSRAALRHAAARGLVAPGGPGGAVAG